MQKISLQIDLAALRTIPAGMMTIFAINSSLAFGSLGMYLQSYILLGLGILCTMYAAFVCIRQMVMTTFELCIVGLFLTILGLSMIGGMDYKNWIYSSIIAFLPLFLFRYYRKHTTYLMIGVLIGYSLSVYLGFVDLLSKPELWMTDGRGASSGYLLGGNYNQMGPIIICAIAVNMIAVKISKWFYLSLIPVCIVSLTMLLIVNSSTAISGTLLLMVLFCLHFKKLQKLATYGILVSVILFEIFVCFQGKGFENNELARWLIIDVLGKDMTFTHRTDMWDSALQVIVQSPLYGYGYPDADWYITHMSSLAIGPHNMILAILIYGGTIGLALYITMIVFVIKKTIVSQYYIPLTAFAVLSIMMLFEAYSITHILFLLILGYFSPEIVSNIKTASIHDR